MKLSEYIKKEETSYAALATKIGSISSISIYRYAVGTRAPSYEIVEKIRTATKGKVTVKDFNKIRTSKTREHKKQKSTHQKWIEKLELWHLNGKLESEFSYDDYDGIQITLPLAAALEELKERACNYNGKYYLDGRQVAIPIIIETANNNRQKKGLVKIIYPGCS